MIFSLWVEFLITSNHPAKNTKIKAKRQSIKTCAKIPDCDFKIEDAKRLAPIKNNTKNSVMEGFSTTHANDFFIELINIICPLEMKYIINHIPRNLKNKVRIVKIFLFFNTFF